MMIFNTSSSIILVDLSLSCKNYIQYKCSPTSPCNKCEHVKQKVFFYEYKYKYKDTEKYNPKSTLQCV